MKDGYHPNVVFNRKVADKIVGTIKLMLPMVLGVPIQHDEIQDPDDQGLDEIRMRLKDMVLS